MEAIAEYLFDNCDDIKEGHYLALMNLLRDARTVQTVVDPIHSRRYARNERINVSSSPVEVLYVDDNVNEFMRHLRYFKGI